jgi:protein-S-isoprenylcysteine O-methyltransferase Ste14
MSTTRDEGGGPGPIRWGLIGRAAGAVWFAALALLYLTSALSPLGSHWSPGVLEIAVLAARLCAALYFGILAWLMVSRPGPLAGLRGFWPIAFALVGTYALWVVPFLPHAPPSAPREVLAACVTFVGDVLTLLTLRKLGRSFSIAPQARALVTDGPYKLVRHPLYVVEEIAAIGVVMQAVWWAALPFLGLHVAVQIRRMLFEERVLRQAFPQYEAYARRTARVIPGVW